MDVEGEICGNQTSGWISISCFHRSALSPLTVAAVEGVNPAGLARDPSPRPPDPDLRFRTLSPHSRTPLTLCEQTSSSVGLPSSFRQHIAFQPAASLHLGAHLSPQPDSRMSQPHPNRAFAPPPSHNHQQLSNYAGMDNRRQSDFSLPITHSAVPPSSQLGTSAAPIRSADNPGGILAMSSEGGPSQKRARVKEAGEEGGKKKGAGERKTRSRLACFACKSVSSQSRGVGAVTSTHPFIPLFADQAKV